MPAKPLISIETTGTAPGGPIPEQLDVWRVRQYIPRNPQPARLRRISGAAV